MRYFATGLKGWVQVRRAKKPPRIKVTEAVVPTTRRRFIPGDFYNFGRTVMEPATKAIQVSTFEGGTILKTVSAVKFRRKLGIGVGQGAYVELQPDQAKVILEAK